MFLYEFKKKSDQTYNDKVVEKSIIGLMNKLKSAESKVYF